MTQFTELGFEIIPEIYSGREIDEILKFSFAYKNNLEGFLTKFYW